MVQLSFKTKLYIIICISIFTYGFVQTLEVKRTLERQENTVGGVNYMLPSENRIYASYEDFVVVIWENGNFKLTSHNSNQFVTCQLPLEMQRHLIYVFSFD